MIRDEKEKKKIIDKIKPVLSEDENIKFAYLYGSFVENQEFNDIDIGVYLDEQFLNIIDSLDYEFGLSSKIEEVVGVSVDVKILNIAPLPFVYHVLEGKPLLVGDENLRDDYLCRIRDDYFDFKPISNIYLKEVLSG